MAKTETRPTYAHVEVLLVTVWVLLPTLSLVLLGVGSTSDGDFTVIGWSGCALGALWSLYTIVGIVASFLGLP